ncbi:MAG: tyrosine-type recombinase/integrase [Erythrobacter sp.]|nr:tyrosine-type recombinase/integrase [Erythrobacter sp.]
MRSARHVLQSQRADSRGVIGAPKSAASFRTIPIPERLVAVLRRWKVACPKHGLNLAFPSVKGHVLSHDVMAKKHLKPILIAAGVTKPGKADEVEAAKYTARIFRHAAASLWIEQGLNPKRVQALVGHGSVQVTFDTYGHLFEAREGASAEANVIARALFGDATERSA